MRKRRPAGKPKEACSKCGGKLEDSRKGKQTYCKACHAQYMRINRPKHSELPDEQRKKANARSYLHVYIRRGKVKKLPCMFCGNQNSEAHHQDYSKPLEVIWLCREHHLVIHENPPTQLSIEGQPMKNLNQKNLAAVCVEGSNCVGAVVID